MAVPRQLFLELACYTFLLTTCELLDRRRRFDILLFCSEGFTVHYEQERIMMLCHWNTQYIRYQYRLFYHMLNTTNTKIRWQKPYPKIPTEKASSHRQLHLYKTVSVISKGSKGKGKRGYRAQRKGKGLWGRGVDTHYI